MSYVAESYCFWKIFIEQLDWKDVTVLATDNTVLSENQLVLITFQTPEFSVLVYIEISRYEFKLHNSNDGVYSVFVIYLILLFNLSIKFFRTNVIMGYHNQISLDGIQHILVYKTKTTFN